MRILFVSSSPLKKEFSIGNTFINLFEGIENVELASIYTRAGKPDVAISKAFCITEKMIVRNLLKKTPVGVCIDPQEKEEETDKKEASVERGLMHFMKLRRWTAFFWMREAIWSIGRWKSPGLRQFIEEYKPDVIFTVFSDSIYLNKLILHIKKVSGAPLVLYAWDNNYSLRRFMISPLKWMNLLVKRLKMKKISQEAALMYVITAEQKSDYEKAFKRECVILTKGECFSGEAPVNQNAQIPVQLLYTGNIGLNRWKSLEVIAKALEKINADGIKAQLRIYTGNEITKKFKKALNREGSSFLMGSISPSKVQELQNKADILVHVEATDLRNRLLVRQSFSTKLVDYFQKGKCIIAFGPKEVASITHLTRNAAAVVSDNEKDLENKLREVMENTDLIATYGQKAWECGKRHHNKETIQAMLVEQLKHL